MHLRDLVFHVLLICIARFSTVSLAKRQTILILRLRPIIMRTGTLPNSWRLPMRGIYKMPQIYWDNDFHVTNSMVEYLSIEIPTRTNKKSALKFENMEGNEDERANTHRLIEQLNDVNNLVPKLKCRKGYRRDQAGRCRPAIYP